MFLNELSGKSMRLAVLPVMALVTGLMMSGFAQANTGLPVKALDGAAKKISQDVIETLVSQDITATSHGETLTYKTVGLLDALRQLAVVPADKLTREHMTTLVEVVSRDGYRVVFSLAELDPAIGHRSVHIAYAADGKALPDAMGDWRLVVPDDGRHARWVWDVVAINLHKL